MYMHTHTHMCMRMSMCIMCMCMCLYIKVIGATFASTGPPLEDLPSFAPAPGARGASACSSAELECRICVVSRAPTSEAALRAAGAREQGPDLPRGDCSTPAGACSAVSPWALRWARAVP